MSIIERRQNALPRGVGQITQCVADHASKGQITDVEGERWIDFAGGIGTLNAGHCPPSVVEAIQAQAAKLIHTCIHVATYEPYIALAEKLNAITPGSFAKKSMLLNSGAEAVENAIKIAKHATGRNGIVCFDNSFHGRTYLGMSLTSKVEPYKKGFGSPANEIHRVPFPFAYRLADGDQKKANQMALNAIKEAFINRFDPSQIAAIIFEPVLGEGGFISADAEFYAELRQVTQSYGILTICDEIQTGFGRTGHFYAAEHFKIDYDMIISAKSLGSGMPISAVTGRAEVMDSPQPGGLGGTYGGNPVSCAAALATIDLFETTDLFEKGQKQATVVRNALLDMAEKYDIIGDVRGVGSMLALEIVSDKETKKASKALTNEIVQYCLGQKLLVLTAGTQGNVIRLLAPLVMDEDMMESGLQILDKAIAHAAKA
ncbi:MAG: 4-aminobutyrate--2-oxoglutarate transaminase [Pseudomonadota bacterium]|nr:4-aminobutyrate--2-oxoglutarate transaminase [Pseudomonadota bacterium]